MTKLEEQIKQYHELAKTDKKIDVASLMISAMDNAKSNYLPAKQKRLAYLLSISVPFVGFYYTYKYFNSNAEDALEAALACGILSCVCLFSMWLVQLSLKSSVPTGTFDQLQNIKPSDVYQLTQ